MAQEDRKVLTEFNVQASTQERLEALDEAYKQTMDGYLWTQWPTGHGWLAGSSEQSGHKGLTSSQEQALNKARWQHSVGPLKFHSARLRLVCFPK